HLPHKLFFLVIFSNPVEAEKLYKVRKFKDFYISFLCSPTTVSTCVDRVIEMHFPEFSLYSGSEKCCNPL
ncbi:hypothetical protein, partial [Waltera sp.]|uniref:hypothetical protein n=1 Tax=Waltera sp. TaxID=2815806 RepID=UPI0039934B65